MNFDRISGERVYDDSGYGNHGVLKGLSSLARDAGKCGHGLKFHGGKCNIAMINLGFMSYNQHLCDCIPVETDLK